jgi:hypothetical protein
MDIQKIMRKLELIKVIIETDNELSVFDFAAFTKYESTKENTYTVYKKRKTYKGELIFDFKFQYTNRKGIKEGSDKFKKIMTNKWNRYKEANKIDVNEIKKLSEMVQVEFDWQK